MKTPDRRGFWGGGSPGREKASVYGRMGSCSTALTDAAKDGNNPWWEVNLGSEQRSDRMVIWNRIESNVGPRMSHFGILVTDRGSSSSQSSSRFTISWTPRA